MQSGRILVVDDEESIRDVLSASLRFLGHEVEAVATGREALERCAAGGLDLVLLDVMLPDADGFEVLRAIRATSALPVVMLTARDGPRDVVGGFDLGADDYVTKPFRLEEVAARVRAVLRRSGTPADRVLRCADLELDPDSYEVRRAGRPVDLSPTEFRLLHELLLHQGRVLTRTQLLERVWGWGESDDGVVKTYVSYLRRKLDTGEGPSLIQTRRGIGYTIREPR